MSPETINFNSDIMKKNLIFILVLPVIVSCSHHADIQSAKNQIIESEKAFEKMAAEKGFAEAFSFFASDEAVIRRGNDSLIKGKENIRHYYESHSNPGVRLTWTPDFVSVSDCGTMGYTYGKYIYSIQDSTGRISESTGVFHTVWKKENNEWRYVWD